MTAQTTTVPVLETLQASFSGAMLRPGDDGYDTARQVHNGLIDKRPALIARCLNTADVVDAVNFGRREGMEISVRGGGHNVAGKAVTDGGLMIDLAPMQGVHVDPRARTVRAQGGVTWHQFNRAAAVHGLATTGGMVSTTGVAGLTLGGGFGWLMGRYGLAVDNLASAEVVMAAGEVLTAGPDESPDLFWALRGGGGNFGVVTSFEFRAHPLSEVVGGMVTHPIAAAADAVGFYHGLTRAAPDELVAVCAMGQSPDGSGDTVVTLGFCHCGDPSAAKEDVAPLFSFATPRDQVLETMPYPVVNTLSDAAYPTGALNYWKSAFLTDLSDGATQAMVEAMELCPSGMGGIIIEHLHGAATRVEPTATAFPHRDPGYSVLVIAQWADSAATAANIAWARDTFEALGPFTAPRRYVNYLSADDAGFVADAYGPNYERLAAAKQAYDPQNLFRLNQNIRPAGPHSLR